MLEYLNRGYRVINCDESALSFQNFTRKAWKIRGDKNTLPEKKLAPRISMLAAISNYGEVWLSLT